MFSVVVHKIDLGGYRDRGPRGVGVPNYVSRVDQGLYLQYTFKLLLSGPVLAALMWQKSFVERQCTKNSPATALMSAPIARRCFEMCKD